MSSMMMPGSGPRPLPTGSDPLDALPPAPYSQAGASAGLVGGNQAPPSGGLAMLTGTPSTPAGAVQGMIAVAAEIDAQIQSLASAAPMLGPKLGQARELIKSAVAEFITVGLAGPQPAGPGFPGGGFGGA